MTIPDETQGSPSSDGGTGNEPPYAKELEALPEDVRALVEPTFKNWDANVTQRFQEYQSQQAPWKEITESYDPSVVGEALQLAQLLESDPKQLYDLMAQTYKFEQSAPSDQGQQPPAGTSNEDEEDPYGERFAKLEGAFEQLATLLINNQNQATAQEQTKLLDSTMASLREKHGDFDEDYILNRLALGDEPDVAIKNYQGAIANGLKARGMSEDQITALLNSKPEAGNSGAPIVTSATGGTPSVVNGAKKPGEMTKGEVTDVVTQMLRQAAEADQ